MLREWDKHFVIALIAGALGIMIYEISQSTLNQFYGNPMTDEDFLNDLTFKGIASIVVSVVAMIYALIYRKKEN